MGATLPEIRQNSEMFSLLQILSNQNYSSLSDKVFANIAYEMRSYKHVFLSDSAPIDKTSLFKHDIHQYLLSQYTSNYYKNHRIYYQYKDHRIEMRFGETEILKMIVCQLRQKPIFNDRYDNCHNRFLQTTQYVNPIKNTISALLPQNLPITKDMKHKRSVKNVTKVLGYVMGYLGLQAILAFFPMQQAHMQTVETTKQLGLLQSQHNELGFSVNNLHKTLSNITKNLDSIFF